MSGAVCKDTHPDLDIMGRAYYCVEEVRTLNEIIIFNVGDICDHPYYSPQTRKILQNRVYPEGTVCKDIYPNSKMKGRANYCLEE